MKMGVVPQLIDNKQVTQYSLGRVLNELLTAMESPEFRVATAYFNLEGWMSLSQGLEKAEEIRLLLGREQEQTFVARDKLREELQRSVLDEGSTSVRSISAWERALRSQKVHVRVYRKKFLHGKAYIVGGRRYGEDVGVVGSSNFTRAGLETNIELNATLFGEPVESLREWFEKLWDESDDYKEELLSLLDDFTREYSPYTFYIKVIYEAYKDMFQIDITESDDKPSPIALADFQNDGYRIARNILQRYGGVLISDSVGLGKTYITLALLDEFAYKRRQTALIISPAALQQTLWEKYLQSYAISHKLLSMEQLSRFDEDELREFAVYPIIVVDESHNFRNPNSKRWENLLRTMQIAEEEGRKPLLILLTATPVNNSIYDLLHQLRLIARDDPAFLSDVGIEDLERYFRRADRERDTLYDVLESVTVRRTRNFIRKYYPNAKVDGEPLKFPVRRLRSVRYRLERTYGADLYRRIAQAIEDLCLAPYQVDTFRKDVLESTRLAIQRGLFDEERHSTLIERLTRKGFTREKAKDLAFQIGRQTAIAHILRVLYLKRLESSVEALSISLIRQLKFQRAFLRALDGGRILKAEEHRRLFSSIDSDDPDEFAYLESRLDTLPSSKDYETDGMRQAVEADIKTLEALLSEIQRIAPIENNKLRTLQNLLSDDLRDRKVIVFTQFKDTARYLYRYLGGNRQWLEHEASSDDRRFVEEFHAKAGRPAITIIDSDVEGKERADRIKRFAPVANRCRSQVPEEREIQILISTDVLSEGQNLQDASCIINYDLHWNPIRLVQRIGRIDRIGCPHDEILVYNFIPEDSLEELLGLLRRLYEKLDAINRTVGLDSSVLGEEPNPKDFNAIRKIAEEDASILDDLEKELEMVIADFIQNDLMEFLHKRGEEYLDRVPLGVGCAKKTSRGRGFFAAFRTKVKSTKKSDASYKHYWVLKDLQTGDTTYNRARAIAPVRSKPGEKSVPLPDDLNPDELLNDLRCELVRHLNRLPRRQKRYAQPQNHILIRLQAMSDSEIDAETRSRILARLCEPLGANALKELRRLWKKVKNYPDDELLQALDDFLSELPIPKHQRTHIYTEQDFECIAWIALV